VATAVKAKQASAEALAAITTSMTTLNRTAAQTMLEFEIHACTDITGFGLMGHAGEMIRESQVGFEIQSSKLPVFSEVENFAAKGLLPGGLNRNWKFCESLVKMDSSISQYLQDVVFDPQTSGGLLIALPLAQISEFLKKLHLRGVDKAVQIGEVVDQPAGKIVLK
jgi:selenide,water dikinase